MSRTALLLALAVAAAGCSYDTHGGASPSAEASPVPTDAGVFEEELSDPDAPVDGAEPDDGGTEDREDGGEDAGSLFGHDDPAVMAAVEAWTARHEERGDLPTLEVGSCIRTINGMWILVPEPDEFFRLCKTCNLSDDSPRCEAVGRANGCAPWHGVYEDGKVHALVVLDAGRAADSNVRSRLVIHETIHHLARCSDHPGDRLHEDRRLWCTDDPRCITARARAALGV